jgi:enoyl-CoA hydratase/carnithine racemase
MTLEVQGAIARLCLRRPEKRNAIDEAFLDELESCVRSASADRRIQVLLLEAQGPVFCAGFDLDILAGIDDEQERKRRFAPVIRDRIRRVSHTLECLARMHPVTVAAVQGAAAGGGFSLALACDLRLVTSDALCWYPEVELGSPLSPVSTRLLVRQVPAAVARDIIFTCRRLNAPELLARGLANRVVEPEHLAAEAGKLVRSLADKPASSLLTSKATVNALMDGHAVLRTDLIPERE